MNCDKCSDKIDPQDTYLELVWETRPWRYSEGKRIAHLCDDCSTRFKEWLEADGNTMEPLPDELK